MNEATKQRRQHGFSFIEILVVMGIIAVLSSMVVVIIPMVTERARRIQSQSNVTTILNLMLARRTARDAGWPRSNGKNFTLDVVATRQLDARNRHNLEVLFSPGDVLYRLDGVDDDRWEALTQKALRGGLDCSSMTSYAGRRNAERAHLITPHQESMGTLVICDDDDGPLHHSAGLIAGYSNGAVRFLEWADLDMRQPADPDSPESFLGDAASHTELAKVSGR